MEIMRVELRRSKYTAYHFDGTEESAKQICKQLSLVYDKDFLDESIYAITMPNGKKCYINNYIVVFDELNFETYTQNQFQDKFTVIDSTSFRGSTFMSGD